MISFRTWVRPFRSEFSFSSEADGDGDDDGGGDYCWQPTESDYGIVVSSMVTFVRSYSLVPEE